MAAVTSLAWSKSIEGMDANNVLSRGTASNQYYVALANAGQHLLNPVCVFKFRTISDLIEVASLRRIVSPYLSAKDLQTKVTQEYAQTVLGS